MSLFRRVLGALVGEKVRPTDIFIVTYPKSGTVWMECLLANALVEKRGEDRVNMQTIDDYVPNLCDIGLDESLRLRRYADRVGPRVFFSHGLFDPRMLRGQVVYVVRDPRDVLVSYYHHQKRVQPDAELTLAEYVRWADYYPCTWDTHIRSWVLDRPNERRVHLVKYEELKADTHGVMRRLLGDLGAAFSEADLDRTVEQSSFERMRKSELKYPSFRGAGENNMHVRKGKAGGWREELSADDLAVIERRYGETMLRMGYRPETPSATQAA